MAKMVRNMLMFTVVLAISTLALQYFRKGHLQIESPETFALTVLFLGIAGGYIYTWTYEKNQ